MPLPIRLEGDVIASSTEASWICGHPKVITM
jgi:hypothetical protein